MNQPSILPPEPCFAAFAAIDWADQKHYWSLRPASGGVVERGILDNTPEAVALWAAQLDQRFGGQPVAVALEQRRGALVVLLSKYAGHLHLYPVHPFTLSKHREAWYPSGSKDDIKDADLLLEIVSRHRDRLRPILPETEDMRLLQAMVENRRRLVDDRIALTNRLEEALKIYFPQIPRWFDNLASELVGDLLGRWSLLRDLQKARPATIAKFLHDHHWYDPEKNDWLVAQIRDAVPATEDRAVIEPLRMMVATCLRQIVVLREAIQAIDREIAALASQQPDWALFRSLPGAGDRLAPRLMAAMGSNRDRFASAADLQCFSGIAPVREASGKTSRVHFRLACPKFLRQTFHEWAAYSRLKSAWAHEFYQAARARGKRHHMAVRALAFKWIRILFRCWRDRVPYSEGRYVASCSDRAASRTRPAVQNL